MIPGDHEPAEQASNEVQFALVIARMIDTVNNNPEHLRQVVYDLARYKLQEQFTQSDANDVKRAQRALEAAIQGVEQFSQQQRVPPPAVPQLGDVPAWTRRVPGDDRSQAATPQLARQRLAGEIDQESIVGRGRHLVPPLIKRAVVLLFVVFGIALAFQQREHLWWLTPQGKIAAPQPQAQAAIPSAPLPPKPKPNPLRPTDYGVYAISDDRLAELQLLPGRAPDIRVAVSAALKVPSQTVLQNGHPKFIVFRRDASPNAADRAEVRIIAKVTREFSAEAAGKKPDESDATWVIRNVSFPFRSSPLPDSPEMYELHSEDPALELPPGRYALLLKGQAYDFTVKGDITDPRQCIERIVVTSGILYTDCKKL